MIAYANILKNVGNVWHKAFFLIQYVLKYHFCYILTYLPDVELPFLLILINIIRFLSVNHHFRSKSLPPTNSKMGIIASVSVRTLKAGCFESTPLLSPDA